MLDERAAHPPSASKSANDPPWRSRVRREAGLNAGTISRPARIIRLLRTRIAPWLKPDHGDNRAKLPRNGILHRLRKRHVIGGIAASAGYADKARLPSKRANRLRLLGRYRQEAG